MKPELSFSLKILKEASQKYNYNFRLVDRVGNNLVEVSNTKKSFFSSNRSPGIFPLNPSFSSGITKDKTWTNKILKERRFKVIKGEHFFLNNEYIAYRSKGRELSDALRYAYDKYPVFVKPNDASSGLFAEVIYNERDLYRHLAKIRKISEIGVIQELKILNEYRIFAVNGRVQFMYQREAAFLRGDGIKNIKELLKDLNDGIIKDENKISKENIYLKKVLIEKKINFNSILPKDKKIRISSKANLSAGGKIVDYRGRASKEINKWVFDLMKVFSLRVAGIDIFVNGSIKNPNNFIVIEINPNPGLSGIYRSGYQKKVIEVWGNIFKLFFN